MQGASQPSDWHPRENSWEKRGDKDRGYSLGEVVESIAGPDRTVILSTVTFNYVDFLENWYTTVDRLGYGGKVVFVADDEKAYWYLKKKWPRQVVSAAQMRERGESEATEGLSGDVTSSFDSPFFNSVVGRRPAHFLSLLRLNVSFLYSDIDIVLLKDPFPYFKGDFDLLVQEDTMSFEGATTRFPQDWPAWPAKMHSHQLCTCFMFVRPTAGSRRLIGRWEQAMKEEVARTKKPVRNQQIWNDVVDAALPPDVSIGVLPVSKFPSGCTFFPWPAPPNCDKGQHRKFGQAWTNWSSIVVIVHNNWISGHAMKTKRFKAFGLWFAH